MLVVDGVARRNVLMIIVLARIWTSTGCKRERMVLDDELH